MTDQPPAQPTETASAARWSGARVLVPIAAALVLVLAGAAAGMLITLQRVDQNSTPEAGSVDVGFAQDMSVHHLQAVTMAGWARERSTDPAVRNLAFDIESTQQSQVGMMRGWLAMWNQPPLSTPGKYMSWMSGAEGHAGMGGPAAKGMMPGMATSAELARLRALTGAEFDVYFLQLMVRHHRGGTMMAKYAAQRAAEPAVRALATSIANSQSAEIVTIESMLAERRAAPLR